MDKFCVLLIDDDEDQLKYFQILFEALEDQPIEFFKTTSVDSGLKILQENNINLVLTDYRMPEKNGFEVLEIIKEKNPLIDVVIITGFADTKTAVELMKQGAYDYLIKPVKIEVLDSLLLRVREKQSLVRENRALREEVRGQFDDESIVFQSKSMEEILQIVARSAKSDVSVLIRGESGTGKELIARAIHYASNRKDKPFVTVNISSLSENLIESELFGHKRGSFTGAVNDYSGRFERANNGTLFIDEVGDIPQSIQVKLLRAIQFGQIDSIGSTKSLEIDARIIAATSRDLEKMIADGEFRSDFYYRLNVVPVTLPPLRERKSDIPALVNHFIPLFAKEHHRHVKGITREALDVLMKYNFPGNIRELENILQRAIVLCGSEYITKEDLSEPFKSKMEIETRPESIELHGDYEQKMIDYETTLITQALKASDYNKSAAARLLGIGERRLRYRMEKLSLDNIVEKDR